MNFKLKKRKPNSKPYFGRVVCETCHTNRVDLHSRPDVKEFQIELFEILHSKPNCKIKVLTYEELKK